MSRFSLSILLLIFSTYINAESIINERVGYARDLVSDELLYSEWHFEEFQGDKILSDKVTYKNADGETIAIKTVDYKYNPMMPDFSLDNFSTGHKERVAREGGKLLVEFVKNEQADMQSKSIPLPGDAIIDAGFDQFVTQHWDELIAGERLVKKLLIPSMKKFIDFRIYQKKVDEENNKRILHIEPNNMVFRMLSRVTQLEYDIDRPVLLQFKGTSNMRDASGKNLQVRIDFPRQEQIARKE